MEGSRRTFLKIAGASLLGLAAKPVLDAFARSEFPKVIKAPQALVAKRWAMVVDMKKFKAEEDYQRCIQACHRAHNVPDIGTKQEVKWIWKERYAQAFPDEQNQFIPDEMKNKAFLLLCNHCDNPPCVRVCPTQATFRRKEDGIVMMDFHRCIGCRYCMAACPYGARSFNFGNPRPYIQETNLEFPTRTKGVVEKCNFCEERVARGLLPACVEVSRGALIFGDLANPDSGVRKILRLNYGIRRRPTLGTQPQVYYLI